MAELERVNFYERFQQVPGYRDASKSPFQVVDATTRAFDYCFGNKTVLFGAARYVFEDSTIPYIVDARRALSLIFERVGANSSAKWPEMAGSILGDDSLNQDEHVESTEALGHSLVLFSYMPELHSDLLPKGFSRKGNLAPPASIDEFRLRLEELHTVVFGISQGLVSTGGVIEVMQPPLMRTIAYFKTGSALALKCAEDSGEYKERESYELHKLIGDIDLGL